MSRNTNDGGCSCESCKATYAAKQWPTEFSELGLARYQRAIDQGKIPNDPVYAAHVRHSRFVPDLEFSQAELRNRSVKVFTGDSKLPPKLEIPGWADANSLTQYITAFDRLNGLKPVEYVHIDQRVAA